MGSLSKKHACLLKFRLVSMMEAHDWLWPVVKLHEGFGPNLLDQIWICIGATLKSEHKC